MVILRFISILCLLHLSTLAVSTNCFDAIDSIVNYQDTPQTIEIKELRKKLYVHIEELEDELFEDPDIEEELIDMNFFIDSPEQVLECPLCTAGSIGLKGMLERDHSFSNYSIELMLTDDQVGDSGFRHFYLVLENKITGSRIIVDPTFRQFFLFKLDRDLIDNNIPKVFVGTEKDIELVFGKFSPEGSLVSSKKWSESYLQAKEKKSK